MFSINCILSDSFNAITNKISLDLKKKYENIFVEDLLLFYKEKEFKNTNIIAADLINNDNIEFKLFFKKYFYNLKINFENNELRRCFYSEMIFSEIKNILFKYYKLNDNSYELYTDKEKKLNKEDKLSDLYPLKVCILKNK